MKVLHLMLCIYLLVASGCAQQMNSYAISNDKNGNDESASEMSSQNKQGEKEVEIKEEKVMHNYPSWRDIKPGITTVEEVSEVLGIPHNCSSPIFSYEAEVERKFLSADEQGFDRVYFSPDITEGVVSSVKIYSTADLDFRNSEEMKNALGEPGETKSRRILPNFRIEFGYPERGLRYTSHAISPFPIYQKYIYVPHGADPNSIKLSDGAGTLFDGDAELINLIRQGDEEKVRELLASGADPNVETSIGWPALMVAVNRNSVEIGRMLIEAGADVNLRVEYKVTPIMWAAIRRLPDIAKMLMKYGADANATGEGGSWERYSKVSALNTSVINNDLELTKILMGDGEKPGELGFLPAVSVRGFLEMTKFLIEAGVDPNKNSPLLYVVRTEHTDIARILIEAGADVNATNNVGRTLLDIAIWEENHEIIELLREHGALRSKELEDESTD